MSDTEILPCPFCGQVPTTFDTTGNGKWGFVQCCINGPEVRASYAPLEEWRERAIAEWNDRKPAQLAASVDHEEPPYPCPTLESCVEWLEGRGELKLETKDRRQPVVSDTGPRGIGYCQLGDRCMCGSSAQAACASWFRE